MKKKRLLFALALVVVFAVLTPVFHAKVFAAEKSMTVVEAVCAPLEIHTGQTVGEWIAENKAVNGIILAGDGSQKASDEHTIAGGINFIYGEGSGDSLPEETVFEGGKKYALHFSVVLEEGYEFAYEEDASGNLSFTGTIAVNGQSVPKEEAFSFGPKNVLMFDLVLTPVCTVCTVTFMDNGKVIDTQTVEYGKNVSTPEVSKKGYILSWDKKLKAIKKDITVKAKWTKISLSKVSVKSLKAGKKQAAVEVKKVSAAMGYEILYSYEDNFKSPEKIDIK